MLDFFPPAILEIAVIGDKALLKLKEFNTQLGVMSAQANTASASLSKLEKTSVLATGALKVMGIATVAVGVLSVKAAMEQETAFARMGAALSQAKDVTSESTKEFMKSANAAIELGFADEQAAGALGTLVTATRSTKEAQMLLGASMDLARYKHIDLSTAATILARGTQGSAKAFKELGITLDTTVPKQEAINKAFDELNTRIGGQAEAYLDTFAGKLSVLNAKTDQLTETIGDKLIPYISKAIDFILRFGKQIGIAVLAFAGFVTGVKLLTIAMAIQTTAAAYLAAATSAVTAAQIGAAIAAARTGIAYGGLTIATRVATGAQAMFSLALTANPIGLMVTAVGLLIAALGTLFWWLNKNTDATKEFNAAGAAVSQGGAGGKGGAGAQRGIYYTPKSTSQAPGYIKGMPALTPEQQARKDAYDLKSYNDAKEKADALKAAQDLANQKAEQLKKANNDAKKIYAEMNNVIKNYSEQGALITQEYNQRITDANKNFSDTMFQANRNKSDALYRLDRDTAQRRIALNKNANDAILDANSKHEASVREAVAKFREDVLSINKKFEIQETAITAEYTQKRKDIVQKSMDLLRSAFASATSTDVGNIFAALIPKDKTVSTAIFNQIKDGVATTVSWWGAAQAGSGAGGIEGVLNDLRTKFAAMKILASNAAKLAGAGYSQTFIQQVVSQGPEIGNQFAEAILNASPEAQSELKSLYAGIQDVSENGLNKLAEQMNSGSSLATKALTDEYAQAAVDLKAALATNSADLATALGEAKAQLDETILGLDAALDASLLATAAGLTNGLAELKQSYDDSVEDMNITLKNSLDDANTTLSEAIVAAKAQFAADVASLSKDTMDSLDALQVKLGEVAKEIEKLAGKKAALDVLTGSPAADLLAGTKKLPNIKTPEELEAEAALADAAADLAFYKSKATNPANNPEYYNGSSSNQQEYYNGSSKNSITINAPITTNTGASAQDISQSITHVFKYGMAVSVRTME